MQSLDPIYLQRLVDGELDRPDVRKLLEMAENNPHLWREMAGAFVENLVWHQDFEQLGHDHSTDCFRPEVKVAQGTRPSLTLPYWFSLAAGILLALTAGLLIGRNSGVLTGEGFSPVVASNIPDSPAGQIATRQLPGEATSKQTLVDFRPDYHLELQDANGNPYLDSEVPLYSAANAQKAAIRLDQLSQIPSEFVDRVNRNGYGIRQDLNYISGRFNDGRRFVIPIRTINLSPGQ